MYAKVFNSIYDGSLATVGPWQALVCFQQLLVLADRHGIVDKTPEAISRQTTIPLDIITTGLAALEAPDPDSRRPDHEGRRIIRLDPSRSWGWQIVNHAHYAQIRSGEERAAYQRQYMRDWRAGKRRTREGDAKPKAKGNGADTLCALPEWVPADLYAAWWKAKPKRARTPKAHELAVAQLAKLKEAGNDPTAILEHCIRSGYQGIFAPHTANGKHVTPPPATGAKCHYCAQSAVKITNDIPHCERLDHLDFAIARRV